MSKLVAVFTIAALITMSILSSSAEARPITTTPTATPLDISQITHQKGREDVCKGGEAEVCLVRTTLEAHSDYIYTDAINS
ncbi:Phytosulfokines 3, partial [Cucurbita argyrosperma subsp. sororia]